MLTGARKVNEVLDLAGSLSASLIFANPAVSYAKYVC